MTHQRRIKGRMTWYNTCPGTGFASIKVCPDSIVSLGGFGIGLQFCRQHAFQHHVVSPSPTKRSPDDCSPKGSSLVWDDCNGPSTSPAETPDPQRTRDHWIFQSVTFLFTYRTSCDKFTTTFLLISSTWGYTVAAWISRRAHGGW